MKLSRFLAIAIIGCLLVGLTAFGQDTTGTVSGTVTSAGTPLPGASVTVTSPSLQGSRTAVSRSNGSYSVTGLPPGDYTVRFDLQGLQTLTKQVTVGVSQTARVDADLKFAAEVTVTGTLIPRPSIEAMSPVTTLDIEELSYRGVNRLEDLLTSLPQVFAAQNSTVSNGASGTATVDLRYLGTSRTLVLIDGRRMSAGDAFATAPDLNFIPAALVKRVDILTGGASSVYGADAVAGVVNFVLDKDFEGVRASISGGSYQHNNNNTAYQAMNAAKGFTVPSGSVWDGKNYDANVALGGKFADGKGHASAYLDYRKTDALLKGARDYTNCSVLGGMTMEGPTCGGSGSWQYGRFQVFSPDFSSRKADLVLDASGPGDTMRSRKGADVFNYAPFNYMQRPDQRLAGGAFINYEFNKHAEGYIEAMLMDDYTDAQIAPSADFNNTTQLNCDNPMLSADEVKKLCTNNGYGLHDIANVVIGRRNVEGGGRDSQLRHDDFRLVAGLKGDITKAWSYDFYGMDAEVHSPQRYANDFNADHLQDALIVDGDPKDPSTWHCRSGNAGCVPWNIFKIGGVTKEALAYLQLPEVLDSGTKTQLINGKITGDLKAYGLAFPSAAEGVRVAIGAGFAKNSLFVAPDLAFQTALGAGSGGPTLPVSGFYNVKEIFAEALIPIVQGASFAKDLSMELGYRRSTYNTNGTFPSWKVQGSYAPMASVKFRAGVNRATRAPNVQELFVPQGLGLGGSTDPCAGTPTFTQEQCARTGVPASLYGNVPDNPAQQYNTLGGGNPKLTPEIADTKSFGVVFTPAAVSGFSASLDFYDIKIKDTIGSLNADDIIKQCATTGNPKLCSLIHRDVAGTLWLFQSGYTITTNQNIGKLGSRGVDVNMSYLMPVGKAGSFNFNLIGTRLSRSSIDTGLFAYDCVGFFGNQCGVPTPKWRHLARASWETPFNTVFSLGWRMLGAVKVDESSSNPALANPDEIPLLKANNIFSIPAHHWFDLAATYKFTRSLQFNIGVNNIFDKEPPLGAGMSPNDYGAGFYNTYDSYGRYVHSSLNFTF